ncbi:hypothetical protein [Streptomyces sp. NBC_00984]|uniref:hypothetical protein n=1 Tax=Streptomyces sp. NBC_00984 TaxID=2903700 RepID=UPI0038683493
MLPSNAAPHAGQMGAFSILGYSAHADLPVGRRVANQCVVRRGTHRRSRLQGAVQQLRAAALSVDEPR